jgi:uncharacterized membrane protein
MTRRQTYLSMSARYFEPDAARGVALILMVIYHIFFCLYFFTTTVPWFNPSVISGAPIAFLFISIAGLSLVLSAGREPDRKKSAKKLCIRGLKLITVAILISVVTWLVYPAGFVIFGVLHLIGCGTILAIPFIVMNLRWYIPFFFGVVILLLAPVVSLLRGPAYLLPLGIIPAGFYTIDYEPLIPWFGVMLLGIALGRLLYPSGTRGRLMSHLGNMPAVLVPFCFLGRHTLIIYLVHVPVIIAFIFIFGLAPLPF